MGDRFAPDRGLQMRMAVMAFLVVVANVVFVTLVLEIGVLFAELGYGLLTHRSQMPAFSYDRLLVFPVTGLFMVGQYRYVCRGVPPSSSEWDDISTMTDLEQRITRLSTQAAVPVPSVAIVYSSTPNCYTIGRRGNATIVVSTGLVAILDDAELDAVLAHELAHVLNRDVTVMTIAVAPFRLARSFVKTLSWGLTMSGIIVYISLYIGVVSVTIVGLIGVVLVGFIAVYDWIVTIAPFVDPGPILGYNISPSAIGGFFEIVISPLAGFAAVLLVGGLLLIPVMLALSVYYLILGVVPRRLSIYREYAADRGAALLTGNPTAFVTALETLTNATDRPTNDHRQATDIQALCLVSGGIGDDIEDDSTQQSSVDDSSSDETILQYITTGIVAHPPIEDRIDRLQEIRRDLEA